MFSPSYKRYVLTMMTLVTVLSLLDSGLIGLLLQPIKEDLQLSDTQLGLLTGIVFGLFYATLGLPMARWADRGNRSTIAALSLAVWAAAVMLCLFVTSFFQLMLTRIGAAVGDAGVKPPAYSLLGDYFPDATERTRAMAIYWSAGPMAALISFVAGGWLNEMYGWRWTLFLAGLPGLVAAIVVKFTVTEPRLPVKPALQQEPPAARMWDVLVIMWRTRATCHLVIALILLQLMAVGLNPWIAAFMMRSHGMGTAEIGTWLGLIFGIGGVAGAMLGAYVSGRWFENDERGQMRLSAIAIGSLVPWFAMFLLSPEKYQALLILCPLMVVFGFFLGPTYALLQRLVVPEMRATSLALMMLFGNLIGLGLGPLIVGMLSDLLLPMLGAESLRYAMLAMSFVSLWSAYHFWLVGRTVKEDLKNVDESVPVAAGAVVLQQGVNA